MIRLASNIWDASIVHVSNRINVDGSESGENIGVGTPSYYTINRNILIDGTPFSVHDVD